MSAYEPGAVAVATVSGVPGVRVFRTDDSARPWVTAACEHRRDAEVTDVRPLVVLDPEDEATVDRVADAIRDAHGRNRNGVWTGVDWLCVQSALLRLISPPKPPEPTGMGAVVEDTEGRRWVRAWESEVVGAVWSQGIERANFRSYYELNAVRVLSEGVR